MKVKTPINDDNNRGQQSKKDLKKEILFTWLGVGATNSYNAFMYVAL